MPLPGQYWVWAIRFLCLSHAIRTAVPPYGSLSSGTRVCSLFTCLYDAIYPPSAFSARHAVHARRRGLPVSPDRLKPLSWPLIFGPMSATMEFAVVNGRSDGTKRATKQQQIYLLLRMGGFRRARPGTNLLSCGSPCRTVATIERARACPGGIMKRCQDQAFDKPGRHRSARLDRYTTG
jgi:hypothetical protein